jgi:hypothetical protein
MGRTIPATIKKTVTLVGRGCRKALLHPREAALILRMACWVAILSALVNLISLPRALQAVSTRVRPRSAPNETVPIQLAHALDLLLGIDLLVFRQSCWKRAVVLHRYLALNGIESRINFGLRKEPNGKATGHAWLECQGQPILEAAWPAYTVTFGFPSANALPHDFALPPEIQRSGH